MLGTIATNHSKALEAHGQALASSLVSGYHLAFAIGAASVVVAIVTALVVLRPLGGRAAAGAAAGGAAGCWAGASVAKRETLAAMAS